MYRLMTKLCQAAAQWDLA